MVEMNMRRISPSNLARAMRRLSLSSFLNRQTLYYVPFSLVLFSLFFFLGLTRHPRGTVPETVIRAQPVAEKPCLPPRVNSTRLDFRSHHRADETLLTSTLTNDSTGARDFHAPPCDMSMSEYTPCQDGKRSLSFPREMLMYRERHCPVGSGEKLRCRVPAPHGYRTPFRWPESRGWAWYANVPHKELTVEKKMQNWVHYEGGGRLRFPGGGTMFPNGANAYIDDIAKLINLRRGAIRTAVDTGCGVASFGAYLMSRDIVTMSFAPRDSHEAQVQFALERGVPAMIGLLSSMRLPYPSRAFDIAHCSRCLIPWGQFDGLYLIEVDRVLRPGGYWILSGPPINWERHWKGWERTEEDLQSEQAGIEEMARRLCWKKLKQKEDLAIWQKPTNHVHCAKNRRVFKKPSFCVDQDPDTAWYTKMEDCLTPLPNVTNIKEVAGGKLAKWPERLTSVPPRIIRGSLAGIITPDNFHDDTKLWKKRVEYYKKYDSNLADKGRYRNLLDMNANFGGFAAALIADPVWVMNAVPVEAQHNTLGLIYERGLIGTYQNWCEAMSTYPRTYDFIHADSIFTLYKDRCDVEDIILEMDRILRPNGSVIIRDDVDIIVKMKKMFRAMQYTASIVDHENGPHVREKILLATKLYWTAPKSASSNKHRNQTTSSS